MTMIWRCRSLRWTSGSPDDPCDWRLIRGAIKGSMLSVIARGMTRRDLRHSRCALSGNPPASERLSDHEGRPLSLVSAPAPVGRNPQTAIATRFPEIAELGRATHREIRAIEAELDRHEAAGHDASPLRQVLRELRWRLEYTADASGIRATLARLRALAALPSSPTAAAEDEDG